MLDTGARFYVKKQRLSKSLKRLERIHAHTHTHIYILNICVCFYRGRVQRFNVKTFIRANQQRPFVCVLRSSTVIRRNFLYYDSQSLVLEIAINHNACKFRNIHARKRFSHIRTRPGTYPFKWDRYYD